MDRHAAATAAARLLRRFRLTRPGLDDLVHIAETQGYQIIDYNCDNPSVHLSELVQELGVASYLSAGRAFAFQKRDIKLIFLCEQMDAEEKKYAIAHELGHIFCGHMQPGSSLEQSVRQEHEANEFAHELLYPPVCVRVSVWLCRHRKLLLIVAALLVLFAGVVTGIVYSRRQATYVGDYYVTQSGERYHLETCPCIENRTNIRRLTKSDLESGQYTPCQICLPEE